METKVEYHLHGPVGWHTLGFGPCIRRNIIGDKSPPDGPLGSYADFAFLPCSRQSLTEEKDPYLTVKSSKQTQFIHVILRNPLNTK